MMPTETNALAHIAAVAYDRTVPDGLVEIWHATLGDLSYGLAREALVELIRTSPYWPKPAEIRERARMVKAHQDREVGKRKQIEGRGYTPSATPRTGGAMVAHVMGRLADAGSDPINGAYLGPERCADIAEAACNEWLARTEAAA